MADARRPDPIAGYFWRLEPAQRWAVFHVLAGMLGGAATFPDMLAFADTSFERTGLFLPWISGTAVIAFPSLLLWVAALPDTLYQAWELAPIVRPLAWVGATSLALLGAPPLLIAVLAPLTFVTDPAVGPLLDWSVYAVAAFAVGSLWAAPLQWLAVRRHVPFSAWLKTAGMALGIAAMVTLLSFSWGFEASHIAWTIGIPFAALIYAVGTLPVISGLLRSSSGR